MSLEENLTQVAAAKPIRNWASTREDIITGIDNQIKHKFEPVETTTDPLTKVTSKCSEIHKDINCKLYEFEAAPFTVQRLAELAMSGSDYYKSLPKYLWALQKVLDVNLTVNDFDEGADFELLQGEAQRDVLLEPINWAKDVIVLPPSDDQMGGSDYEEPELEDPDLEEPDLDEVRG